MRIFKYISDNDFEIVIDSIFKENLIKFSKAKEFNDPFELKPHFTGIFNDEFIKDFRNPKFLKNILKEQYNSNNEINRKMSFKEFFEYANTQSAAINEESRNIMNSQSLLDEFNKNYSLNIERFGILSLTTKEDNLLMWSHYANSHKGFVIEFDLNNDFFNTQIDSKFFCSKLDKVEYSEKRPSGKLADFENFTSICLTKSKEWEYEDEYRMFMPLEKAYSSSNDLFLFKFPRKMIKAVYLGCNMSIENKNIFLNLIKFEKYLNHIEIFQSRISEKDYKLVFNKINL